MTSDKLPDINSLSKIAETIYADIPADVLQANSGNFIAIELDSKEYFFGFTKDEAVQKAKQKNPKKLVFIRRVGNVEKIQKLYRKNPRSFGSKVSLSHASILR